MALVAGTRLGPYEIVAPLGAGGMGDVYRARDTRLNRAVAIKVLPAHAARDPQFRDRFEREGRAASALNHPNILSVFDVGCEEDTDFLVTELVEGSTLRERITTGPLPVRDVVAIGGQIADGLAAAHAAQIVHRDLKPENIMVGRDGRVKILDFGLAKPFDGTTAAQHTRTAISYPGLLVGTVGYIAPEQVRGAPAAPQSDLFGLGVVLYEMASGRRAFEGETSVEVLNAILKDDVRELPPDVPEPLQKIITHCLEKQPESRFQTAADVAFALRTFGGKSTAAMPRAVAPVRGSRFRRRARVAVVGMLLVVAGFGLALALIPPQLNVSAIEMVPLAVEAAGEYDAAISPDGRSVAYVRSSADGFAFDIVVKSNNAAVPAVLLRGRTTEPSGLFWSPGGDRVYFVDGLRLRSIGTVGGEVREELASVNGVHLGPDGKTFAAMMRNDAQPDGTAQLYVGGRNALRHYEPPPVSVPLDCTPNLVRFSPDGLKILLWLTCGGNALYVVPAPDAQGRGATARRLWEGRLDTFPQGADWLNDSRHVVIASGDSLWVGDTMRGTLTRTTPGMAALRLPSTSRDNTIAITEEVQDYDVVEMPVAGGTPHVLINSTRYDGSAVWSPRGGALAYVVNRGHADEIWLRTDAGEVSDRRVLARADFSEPPPDRFRALTFSPDGQWLAFSGCRAAPALDCGVWVIPAGGGAPRRISPPDALSTRSTWSPDGRRMALDLTRGGRSHLCITTVGTSDLRQITLPAGLDLREIEWSPIGNLIAAFEFRPDFVPRGTLLIDAADGAIRRLPTLESGTIAWSRDGKVLYGLATGANGSELRALDIGGGRVRTVATYDRRVRIAEDTGNARRLTWSPDGRSLVTTMFTNRSNVWLLKNLELPRRSWWPR